MSDQPLPGPGPYPGVYASPPPPAPFVVPPPPGTRFDLMARNRFNRWWRPVAGTAAIIAGFFVISIVMGVGGGVLAELAGVRLALDGARFFQDPVLDLAFQLALIAIVIPLVFGAAWLIQRRPPGTVSSVAGRIRWRWLLRCLPWALLAVVLGEVAQGLTLLATGESWGYGWAGWDSLLVPIVIIVALVPFQAAAEEYVFRGWVVQAFGAWFRSPWAGIIIGSAGFAALHGYTDWGIAYVFGFGILMGWTAVRTGGLEGPIALHAVNNLFAFGVTAAGGDLESALNQGSLPWQTLVGTAVQFAVFTAGVLISARKSEISEVSQ